MTPGARLSAAIEVLDLALAGQPLEQALTAWGRRSRFAGSKDRRAVRDHVFDAWRRRRSYAALGGAETGRGLILGALRHAGVDPAEIMTGEGHAPAPITALEASLGPDVLSPAEKADLPDWLFEHLMRQYGEEAASIGQVQRDRAPVFLRVNLVRATVPEAQAVLLRDGIVTEPVKEIGTALHVTENNHKIKSSQAYLDGRTELQDASSQAAVLALPLEPGAQVLDYCAGGGGKALAMAARAPVHVTAHDAHPARMRDLPARAARAGQRIEICATRELAGRQFDLVLVDAPCSGSGTWRRDPGGKWRLTPDGLAALCRQQAEILSLAAAHTRPGGHLAYATCSVIGDENQGVTDAWLRNANQFARMHQSAWLPGPVGDGFYLSVFTRSRDAT